MRCIIVEDQTPAQRVLKKYIADLGNLDLQGTFSNPIDALTFLKSTSVDIIFLDVHLPKLSGIDFLKAIAHPPAVILTTAFSDYAVQGYELDVVDYLVKPYSFERFVRAVTKVISKQEAKLKKDEAPPVLFVKTGHEYHKVNPEKILYIHSDMDYTELYLVDNRKVLSNDRLSGWMEKLPTEYFIRVHKSYVVNVLKIDKVSGNQIILNGKIEVPIGRAYKDDFLSKVVR